MSVYKDLETLETMLDSLFDKETGEVFDEQEQAYQDLKQEIINNGIEKMCFVMVNKQNYIDGLKAEEKRIADKRKSEEKKLERLEDMILGLHTMTGNAKTIAGSFTISTRKSTSVGLADDFRNEDYQTIVEEVKIDKMAIKKDLASGKEIAGAWLIGKQNLQVK